MQNVVINGTEYAPVTPDGNRAVVVVDRGWIFAGDVTEKDGRILLSRAIMVLSWQSIGFNGMIDNPKDGNVKLRTMKNDVDIPAGSEIFRIPVTESWGL